MTSNSDYQRLIALIDGMNTVELEAYIVKLEDEIRNDLTFDDKGGDIIMSCLLSHAQDCLFRQKD